MSEQLFPDRRRCKKCRKGLGERQAPVLMGLYCSWSCAGLPMPAARADDAPRQCRTQRDGGWVFKRRYRHLGEIPQVLRDQATTSWYWCTHCAHLHIGRTLVRDDEQFRMFEDLLTDLPDLLVKLRGQVTHKQVAAAAGVRPIRIKELEQGIGHSESLVTLAKVLSVYRVRLGVALTGQAT